MARPVTTFVTEPVSNAVCSVRGVMESSDAAPHTALAMQSPRDEARMAAPGVLGAIFLDSTCQTRSVACSINVRCTDMSLLVCRKSTDVVRSLDLAEATVHILKLDLTGCVRSTGSSPAVTALHDTHEGVLSPEPLGVQTIRRSSKDEAPGFRGLVVFYLGCSSAGYSRMAA